MEISLLDFHNIFSPNTLQKSSETLGTRVPFDRDRDLGVSGLGAKDKSKIIENAKELAGRFKHGAGKYDC